MATTMKIAPTVADLDNAKPIAVVSVSLGISVNDAVKGMKALGEAMMEVSGTITGRLCPGVFLQANLAGYTIINKRGRNKLVDLRRLPNDIKNRKK